MPLGRAQHGRNTVGRRLLAAAQAWELRPLGLRETLWFYCVGVITAAILVWSPSQPTPPQPPATPTVPPVAYERPSETIDQLGGPFSSYTQADRTIASDSLATAYNHQAPPIRIRRVASGGGRPATAAAITEFRAPTRDASTPVMVVRDTSPPRLSVPVR